MLVLAKRTQWNFSSSQNEGKFLILGDLCEDSS